MSGYQYGSPPSQARPQCWGDERYHNPNNRECRACYYQTSCKDQVLRARGYQQTAAPQVAPPTVAPYGYVPAPPGAMPHVAPIQVAPQQNQQVVRQPPPQQGIYPTPERYGYGWLTDPMYYQMAASPPPMIPQLESETFFERLLKNMVIDGMRSLTLQLHLATRQWAWPTPFREQLAREQVLDATQPNPQLPGPHQ